MQNSASTLEARNLSKRYNGIIAVDDISFTIRPGEVLGYLGPNSSGKSTTVKMLIGLIDPSQGTILLNGASVLDDLPEYQRRIGCVLKESNLYPYICPGASFCNSPGACADWRAKFWMSASKDSCACFHYGMTATPRFPPGRRGCARRRCCRLR